MIRKWETDTCFASTETGGSFSSYWYRDLNVMAEKKEPTQRFGQVRQTHYRNIGGGYPAAVIRWGSDTVKPLSHWSRLFNLVKFVYILKKL